MIFDFSGRYQAAFGFVSGLVSGKLDDNGFADVIKSQHNTGYEIGVYLWDDKTKFDEVLLYNENEEYLFGFSSLVETQSEIFATPPMLSLKRAKKLVITPIDNSDIEVVERYATEPWEITWRGLLVDMENHEFPLDKMEQLNKIFEQNSVWNVASEILNKVGVQALYIKDINIDFIEGYEDTVSYNFTARAIRPLEYQLINE
jgi:hypothetical protein